MRERPDHWSIIWFGDKVIEGPKADAIIVISMIVLCILYISLGLTIGFAAGVAWCHL